ncbi:MAG: hypothetical protein SFU98_20885 [Leptospiraceae bacterium]|nr:hypothetical protein [Leptospiraceae bacterium]
MKLFSRKDATIIFLTVPMILEYCATNGKRLSGKFSEDPILNSKEEGLDSPILMAINVGITAPNPHNTQAWKFKIISPTEANLYVDEKRILPLTDPSTRQIHIGQGTFLEVLKIGATKLGYEAKIKLLPEGDYKQEEIGKKPIANIKLVSNTSTVHELFESIKERRTDRSIYIGENITEAEFQKVLKFGNAENSEIKFLPKSNGSENLQRIFFESMKLETKTIKRADESRTWFRFSDKEIQTKRDGIALPDQGVTGFTRWMLETFLMSSDPKDFHNDKGTDMFLAKYKDKIDSQKGIVYWKTKTNTRKDWILVGMDYARFHLALTKEGLTMHPLSQALQEYPEMDALRKELEVALDTKSNEKVQMISRLGRSDYRYFTPRRSPKEMIVS